MSISLFHRILSFRILAEQFGRSQQPGGFAGFGYFAFYLNGQGLFPTFAGSLSQPGQHSPYCSHTQYE
jgi:hypothetical protein